MFENSTHTLLSGEYWHAMGCRRHCRIGEQLTIQPGSEGLRFPTYQLAPRLCCIFVICTLVTCMLSFHLGRCLQSLTRQLGDNLVDDIMLDVISVEVLRLPLWSACQNKLLTVCVWSRANSH